MTPEQIKQLREALYLARRGAERDLDDALRILGEQLNDGTYIYSIIGADVLREAEDKANAVFPNAYTEAFSALREELKLAPDVGGNAPEPPDPYVPPPDIPDPETPSVPPDDFEAQVLRVLSNRGFFIQDGMFGFGGIDPRSAATVQVFGNKYVGDASIQLTTGSNIATSSLSGDGGLRDLNNQRVTKEGVPGYDPDGDVHFIGHLEVVNPNKHHSQIGTDSRHNPSWKRVLPANATKPDGSPYAPHEYTQDVVLEINEDEKQIRWASYRRGWTWAFASDAKYGPLHLYRILREWMAVLT